MPGVVLTPFADVFLLIDSMSTLVGLPRVESLFISNSRSNIVAKWRATEIKDSDNEKRVHEG